MAGWRAGVFLLGVGLAALFMAGEALRLGMAASSEESVEISQLRRALRLDPDNPQLHHRLGLVYSFSRSDNNLPEALRQIQRATELNPHRAIYWLSLASTCDSLRDTACADRALDNALRLSPMTPRLHWIAANRYLLTDRPEAALAQFRRLFELSSQYNWAAFQLCLETLGDPMAVLERVVPPQADAGLKLSYVNFLSAQGEADAAYRVWGRVAGAGSPFAFSSVETYLGSLFAAGRYQEAAGVWRDLERLGVVKRPASDEASNLMFNGDFEQDVLNAGFDWRTPRVPYVSLAFPDSGAYRGRRCLRLEFNVARNEESEAVYQFVPVAPGQAYSLTAYARSDSITSDSGPRLRVLDPVCPSCLDISSDGTVGTTPWHPLQVKFTTGAQTQVVLVATWRPRSRSFPTEIKGTFWLDAVSLEAVASDKGRMTRKKG